MINYKEAGVDIDKGEQLVVKIKERVKKTYHKRVYEGVGGFSSLYEITEDKLIAASTDGVGTKLRLAIELNTHDTIGQDLVAMCVNDLICTGATPLFFLDYLASSKIDLETHDQVIKGICDACLECETALIGGETAEMPGMYQPKDYDLAGFSVGEVLKKDLLGGKRVKAGDSLLALASSGFHSNGYSLLRKLVKDDELDLKRELLTPTKLYHQTIKRLKEEMGANIHGISHITGGGLDNIKRMNPDLKYNLKDLPDVHSEKFKKSISPIFSEMAKRSKLDDKELYKTFNMGMGLVIATDAPNDMSEVLKSIDCEHFFIGSVE